MRVLQVNAVYGYGSTGLIMKDIGDVLTKNGDESFFAFQRSSDSIQNGYVIGSPLDWKIHAFECRLFGGQACFSKRQTEKFLSYLDSVKPDVVHLHNLHNNYINLELLLQYIKYKNIPLVVTLHDCWYFTGKCTHYVDIGCEGFKTGCGKCPKRFEPPASILFDKSSELLMSKVRMFHEIHNLTLVGCSQWICHELQTSMLSDCRIEQIYNGVDTEIFTPSYCDDLKQKYKIDSELVVIGMANKWLSPDNRELCIQISHEENMKLLLIGCTTKQKEYLSTIEGNIISVGYIRDRKELACHYSLGNVFVNLTHADTLPTVNMESICCGTPVVTYDSCGSPELIDKESGIVVREGNYRAILKAIKDASKLNRELCAVKGKTRFDKKECYKKYLDVYKKSALGS